MLSGATLSGRTACSLQRRLTWTLVLAAVIVGAAATCPRSARAEEASLTIVSAVSSESVEPSAAPPGAPVHAYRMIGISARGRGIVAETFGNGRRRVLLMGGLHGNEYGAPVVKAFARYVRAHPSIVPSGSQLVIVACANPDGYFRHRRANANGVDLNRNFPSRNWRRGRSRPGLSWGSSAGSEPETKALVSLLDEGGFIRIVSLHSRGGILDWDGPGGSTLAKRMSKRSRVRIHRLGHRPGSMGTYVPQRHGIPIITWELSSRRLSKRVRAGLLAAVR